jgi:peptidoglycan/xylan/chitin deacetylase (PgdA/CDA1 family)
LQYYIDYPIFTSSNLNKTIHAYFTDFIDQKQSELENNFTWSEEYITELHASFQESEWENIKSIVYEIYEYLWWANWNTSLKIFYINDKWEELTQNDIFNLNEENKSALKDLLFQKINILENTYNEDHEIINWLDIYLEDMTFYIDWEKIIFLFNPYLIWPGSSGIIRIEVNISELKDYLMPNEAKTEKWDNNNSIVDIIAADKEISKDKKYVALTFDDGPSKINTPILLDTLKKHKIKATFFVLWKNASYFPEIIEQENKDWHEIWNHSWSHPQLTRLDENAIKKQIEDTDDKIYEIIWKIPTLFRPPYSSYNETTDKIIDRTIVIWNVDSLDWKNKDVKKNIATIKSEVKEWSIILMHDIHKTTIDSVEWIIKMLKDEWYNFLTVSELLKHYQWDDDYTHKTCFWGFNCR